jgi:tetratricopeptide (TPR) repeat protein
LSAQVQSTFGRILYRARRFDEAIVRLNRASELEPRNGGVYFRLAAVYRQMGRYDEAFNFCEKAELFSRSSINNAGRAITYARAGRVDAARRILANLPPGGAAAVHAALGDRDAAFEALFRELEKREQWPLFIKADPDFDSLHGDPRWPELLRRMRLESD